MNKKKIALFVFIGIVLVVFAASSIFMSKAQKNLEVLKITSLDDINLNELGDGDYIGEYSSFPVSAKVKVNIKNHIITKIELVEHNNGKGKTAEIITDKVIELQSLEVDAISGATFSSKVILKAIENALNKGLNQ